MFGGKQNKAHEPEEFTKQNRLDYELMRNKKQRKQSGAAMKEIFKTLKTVLNHKKAEK